MDVRPIAYRYKQAFGQRDPPHDDHDEPVKAMVRAFYAVSSIAYVDMRGRSDVLRVRVPAADEMKPSQESLFDLKPLSLDVGTI